MSGRCAVRISREGTYCVFFLAFVVGGAVLRDINLLFILAGMMVGPLLWNWRVVVLSLRQFHVQRRIPDAIVAGQPFRVEIKGWNRRRRMASWMILVEDSIRPGISSARSRRNPDETKAAVVLPFVGARSSGTANYQVMLPHRGVYEFGPLQVSTRFPLGLVRASAQEPRVERIVVWPRLGTLTPRWLRLVDSDRLGRQPVQYRQGPIDGDYYGLREWRPGDSRRWIHWRTSARLGTLAVRQFEQLQNQDLVVIVDLWQPADPTDQQRDRVELAVSLAATLVDEVTLRGGSRLTVGLAAVQQHRCTATASRLFARQLLERLAVAEACADNGLLDILGTTLAELPPGARVLVVSTREIQLEEIRDSETFAGRHRHQRALGNVIWMDVSDPKTESVFEMDRT